MNNTVPYTDMKDSGIKWIGSVPASWNVRTLYQLATRVNNKNTDLSEQNLLSLSYGKIKRKDINTNDGLLPASFDGYNIIEAGDIVLRLTDLQNDHTSLRVGHATERGIITSAYTTLRPLNPAHSRYLYYLIHAFDLKKGFYGMGSGVRQGLNYNEVKELRVVIPSQEEQDAIVEYLDQVCAFIDALVSEAKATIKDFSLWKLAIIFEAVTKGINKTIKLKDSGLKYIGTMPCNWQLASLKHLFVLQRGYDLPKESFIDGEIPVCGSNGIIGYHNEVTVRKPCITIGRSGSVGKVNYYDCDAWVHNTAIYVKEMYDNVPKYLYYILMSLDMEYLSTKTAVPTLDRKNIQNYIYPYTTDKSEQQRIADFLDERCDSIETLKNEQIQLIAELEQYKRSIIYETVTGKRKVV